MKFIDWLFSDRIAIRIYSTLITIMIALFVCFIFCGVMSLCGCSSMDREMMEFEGTYDCVVMSDGGAFCK